MKIGFGIKTYRSYESSDVNYEFLNCSCVINKAALLGNAHYSLYKWVISRVAYYYTGC